MRLRIQLFVFTTLILTFAGVLHAQIFAPEGLNMPGQFNAWTNPPYINSFAGIQKTGGTLLLDTTLATRRYKTLINIQASGGDTTGGTYSWIFTSGPGATPYQNKWASVSVAMDSLQTYSFQGGTDNSVLLVNGNYYTVVWRDAGYAGTQAIWMRTSAPPVTIPSVAQSPLPGSVTSVDSVTVSVTISGPKSPEENIYVRYSSDNFTTSALVPVAFTGTSGTAKIPPHAGGTAVKYYVFSTTTNAPATSVDIKTIQHNNNNRLNYSYTVNASSYTITASAGPNGMIAPSGVLVVNPGDSVGFAITPDIGHVVDSVIVDGVYAGDQTFYAFTNISANHSIRAVFALVVDVTFRVNMKKKMRELAFQPDLGDVVTVRGSFNDWGNSTNNPDTLQDGDTDSTFVLTKQLKGGSFHEFKFWKTLRSGQDWEGDIGNRQLSLASVDTVLPGYFFNDEALVLPPVGVTFQLNMRIKMLEGSFRPDLGDVATVRGNFNDWGNSTGNPDTLTDGDGDSVYTRVVAIPGGQSLEYKFWKSLRFGQSYEDAIPNRTFALADSSVVLPSVLFDDDTSSLICVDIPVIAGWNLLSLPVRPADDSVRAVFPTSSFSYAFRFNQASGYQQSARMLGGVGYWLKFSGSGTVRVCGVAVTRDSIPVVPGWNILGSISFPVDTADIISVPGGIRASNFFGFSAGYSSTEVIQPGKGYWVKANAPGSLVLHNEGTTPLSAPGAFAGVREMNSITIKDARGARQTLYFGPQTSSLEAFMSEMPPAGPDGVFDARFASNRLAESHESGSPASFPIHITSAVYPLEVSWHTMSEHGTYSLEADYPTGREMLGSMSASGTARLERGDRLVITAGGEILPREYSLKQNYPNPFNPTTTIRFNLPVDTRVTVKIFDLLGREVTTLVNGVRSAGTHSVVWDGHVTPGVEAAAGVYFYRMEAAAGKTGSGHVAIRKMLLLK